MAVIQKIRNKYGKLAGGIIALALVGFILMDAASGRFGDLFGHDNSVAKVNGEKIDVRDYSERTKEYETLYSIFSKNKTIDDNTRAELNGQALQNMVYEKVAEEQCEKLGLQTTPEEAKDIIYGSFPDPLVQQFPYFANRETGMFDPQYVKAFEQQAAQLDPTGKLMEQWQNLKSYVLRNNTTTKFSSIIAGSVYVPKFIINRKIKDDLSKASINFVKVPYTSVADNEVKVTDEDVNAFVQKHKASFQVYEPMRSIEYVSFDVIPSHDDTAKVLDAINKAKTDLATATDKDAESVVNRNSDDEHYTGAYFNKNTFQSRFADSIMNLPVGAVYGPYYEDGSFKITKVIDKKVLPDSVKCRHILVTTKSRGKDLLSDSAAKKRLDSAIAALKGGMDFKQVVAKYSDDEGSKKTGGEYTFQLLQRPGISKEFGDFIFEGKTGENKIVHVSNDNYSGYHYIEILDQKAEQPAVKLATINKELAPSDATQNAAYAKANEFAGKNATAQAFDEAIKKEGLNKKVADGVKASDFTIAGIGPDRDVIKWIYDAKVGDVSGVFSAENRYVVAKLSGIQDKGLLKVDANMRPRIESVIRQEKKAQLIAGKYKGMTSLDAIAKTTNGQIQAADSFSISSAYIPNLGFEPKAVGYTFYAGLNPNTVSPGIKGSDGVLFIDVTNRWQGSPDPNMTDMLMGRQRASMEQQQKGMLNQALRQELIDHASVKYNPKNI